MLTKWETTNNTIITDITVIHLITSLQNLIKSVLSKSLTIYWITHTTHNVKCFTPRSMCFIRNWCNTRGIQCWLTEIRWIINELCVYFFNSVLSCINLKYFPVCSIFEDISSIYLTNIHSAEKKIFMVHVIIKFKN